MRFIYSCHVPEQCSAEGHPWTIYRHEILYLIICKRLFDNRKPHRFPQFRWGLLLFYAPTQLVAPQLPPHQGVPGLPSREVCHGHGQRTALGTRRPSKGRVIPKKQSQSLSLSSKNRYPLTLKSSSISFITY